MSVFTEETLLNEEDKEESKHCENDDDKVKNELERENKEVMKNDKGQLQTRKGLVFYL